MPAKDRPFKVLIAFPPSRIARGEKMRGVYRFLSSGARWYLSIMPDDADITPSSLDSAIRGGIDGILITGKISSDVMRFISRIRLPCVCIALSCPRRVNIAFVAPNRANIGRTAANAFLSRGMFNGFGIVPQREPTEWMRERASAFAATIAKAGFSASEFGYHSPERDADALAVWLAALPRPAAVFAANDYRANDVLVACAKARLRVPFDVSVIGVDNDPTYCENTTPPLTSIQPDFEWQGFRAAELLHEIMSFAAPFPAVTERDTTAAVVWRASTPKLSANGRLVQRAVTFINQHAADGIRPMDVVRHLKVSRRLAEMRFREVRGETILEAIVSARLEATRAALLEGGASIAATCWKCGWRSENAPKPLFKRRYGVTMREFVRAAAKKI